MADEQKPGGSAAPAPQGRGREADGRSSRGSQPNGSSQARRAAPPKPPATMAATPGIAIWRAS